MPRHSFNVVRGPKLRAGRAAAFARAFAIGIAVVSHTGLAGSQTGAPDIVLYNANVITLGKMGARAEAVVISGDRIFSVGPSASALELAGADTRLIDLEGKTLVPGFNDNHTHSFAAGAFYRDPILWGLSCEEIQAVVREAATSAEPGELITGNAWDYPTCPDPHRSLLDEAAPDNPVFLGQFSGHAAWVNSRMLEQLGIDRNTPDPEGGQIVRDARGEPTGVVRDAAMGGAQFKSYSRQLLSPKDHRAAVRRALELYREAGITSVQDNTWEPLTTHLLARYRRKGELSCRVACWPLGERRLLGSLMRLTRYDEIEVRWGPTKYFVDGAFSTRTAWLDAPYADEPGNVGAPALSPEALEEIVTKAARKRRQVAIHAIGDRAVHEVLNAIEATQARYPETRELRIRLEHVQLVRTEDIPRMKTLGVVAAVQPFALATPGKDVKLLGAERAKRAYPYLSLHEAGIPVAFGSDVPAEVDYRPLLGIYYAVTRKDKAGAEGPLNPDERFTPEEALRRYTLGSAYAEFMEQEKGSITAGKLADLVVLSGDLTQVPPEQIKDLEVLMTIKGGEVVYERR